MWQILAGILCGAQAAQLGVAGLENQRGAVVAPALPRRLGAIVKHMAMMAAAAGAMIFRPWIDQFEIGLLFKHTRQGREEARPPGTAVVLHFRCVNGQVAACAVKHTLAFLVVQVARECAFGTFVPQHTVLSGRQALFPVGFRQLHFFDLHGSLAGLLKGYFYLFRSGRARPALRVGGFGKYLRAGGGKQS